MSYKLQVLGVFTDLNHQPIPGTDRQTTWAHAIMMSFIHNCCFQEEEYCFASTEYLANLLDVPVRRVYEIRADLVRLGWLTCEHGDRNKVTKMWSNLVLELPTQGVSPTESRTTVGGCYTESRTTPTSVSTPVPNKNYIKEEHMYPPCGNSENGSELPPSEPLSSADGTAVGRHPQEGSEGGVVKNTTPFGVPVNLKPTKKANVNNRVAAMAEDLLAVVNPREKVGGILIKNLTSLLAKGYTFEDLMSVARLSRTDDYYYDKSGAVIFSDKGVGDLMAKQKKLGSDKPVTYGTRGDGSHFKLVDGREVPVSEEEWVARKRNQR